MQGTVAEREIAMQQIESTMQHTRTDDRAVEQMIAHNKKDCCTIVILALSERTEPARSAQVSLR
ncbi:hypothetical protein Q0F98_03320 [Paenibacillus amylolyticus]|nr:hypothetical protein Q0F98_03320 [Paenibacillus amylolyticus]